MITVDNLFRSTGQLNYNFLPGFMEKIFIPVNVKTNSEKRKKRKYEKRKGRRENMKREKEEEKV